jgi:hypothetical protein
MGRITESEALPEDCLQKGQCHFRKYQTKYEASRGLTPRGPVSLQENFNQVKIHRGLTPDESVSLQEKTPNTLNPLCLVEFQRGYLLYSSSVTSCLAPVLEEAPGLCLYDNWIFTPYLRLLCFFMALESYLSNLIQGPTLN